MGVRERPTFVIAGKYVMPAGISLDFWSNIMKEIADNLFKAGSA